MKTDYRNGKIQFCIDARISQKTLMTSIGGSRHTEPPDFIMNFNGIEDLEETIEKLMQLRNDFYYEYL